MPPKFTVRKPVPAKTPWLAVDTETTGLEVWQDAMPFAVGICDYTNGKKLYYWEWEVDPFTRIPKYDPRDIKELKEILEDPSTRKVGHNLKFDYWHLRKMGITLAGRFEETHFAARVSNNLESDNYNDSGEGYRLKVLAEKYLDIPQDDQRELKQIVSMLRGKAKDKGWKLHESPEADYWLVKHARKLGVKLDRDDYCEVYCQGDVVRTALLWEMYEQVLDHDPYLRGTYEAEIELLKVVMAMEDRGVHISRQRTIDQRNGCIVKSAHHMKVMEGLVKKQGFKTFTKPTKTGKTKELPFKPGSPAQLARLLYGPEEEGGYELECSRWTKANRDSTDWKALRPHQEHPFVRELMMWRSADKAIDTFFGKYLEMMRPDPLSPGHPDSYVLHCSLNQCGTGTGRFSCNDPNLQQVANPESSPRGTDVHAREPFGPRPGYFWYTPDYAQMELRGLADVGQIEGLLEIINSGQDPNNALTNRAWGGHGNPAGLEAMAHALELGHDYPAHEIIKEAWNELGWTAEKAQYGMRSSLALKVADTWLAKFDYDIVAAEKAIGKKQSRQRGKTVMFTNMYGGGADAVVDILFCTKKEALQAMKDISRAFPDIAKFMRELSAQAAEDGYIINKYDRKLRVDERFAYRAVNYMIQSTCADLMKRGIQRCHDFLRSTGLDAHVLLTIHDELIFEIKKEHAYKSVLREIARIMSDTEGRLTVPMPVEMQKCRYSWEKKETVDL